MIACHFCRTDTARPVNGNHWTGTEYVRVDMCAECFGAGRPAKAPRQPRGSRRRDMVPATDWNYLVAMQPRRSTR